MRCGELLKEIPAKAGKIAGESTPQRSQRAKAAREAGEAPLFPVKSPDIDIDSVSNFIPPPPAKHAGTEGRPFRNRSRDALALRAR